MNKPLRRIQEGFALTLTNYLCRKAPGIGGRLVITQGIRALSSEDESTIREKVERFDAFTEDCDPYGEHDFGSITHNDKLIFW